MKKLRAVTRNIAKKGFSGMQSVSPALSSVSVDSAVLRIPFQAILPPLPTSIKRICTAQYKNINSNE